MVLHLYPFLLSALSCCCLLPVACCRCCYLSLAQASLSAFEADFVSSADMQDYVVSLQRATTTLENSMPLPPLGEHVTYLQNALVSFVISSGSC